jgi:hypothetical protein
VDKWFLARAGGSPIGPVRTDALLRRIRGGTLAPETLVWAEGMRQWMAISRVPQLAAELMRDVEDTSPSGVPEVDVAEGDSPPKMEDVIVPKSDSPRSPKPKVDVPSDRPKTASAAKASPTTPLHPGDEVPTWVDPPSSPRKAPFKRVDTPPAPPPYPPQFLRPPDPLPTPFPVRQTARTPAQASASGKQARQRTYTTVGVVFVVGLVVGMFGIRELIAVRRGTAESRYAEERLSARSRQTLFVPCFGAPLPDLSSMPAGRDGQCDEAGTLTLKNEGGAITMTLKGLEVQRLAIRTPELVARVLPNLPEPTLSRALPARQLLRMDLRGVLDPSRRLQSAIKTYRDAEMLAEGYESMGGHRFARWMLEEGMLDAENRVTPDGPAVVVRLHPKGEAAPPDAEGSEASDGRDAPWKGAWEVPADPPDVVRLRKAMMAEGFWFDDAGALMNAAAEGGFDRTAETADALAVFAHWARTSDGWATRTRTTIWNDCLSRITLAAVSSTQAGAAPSGSSHQRYEELAGVGPDAAIFAELLADKHPQGDVAFFGRAFNASIGSPLHMFCVTQAGQRMLQSPDDSPENRVVQQAPDATRSIVERLIASPQFATAVGAEFVRARTQLLQSGELDP